MSEETHVQDSEPPTPARMAASSAASERFLAAGFASAVGNREMGRILGRATPRRDDASEASPELSLLSAAIDRMSNTDGPEPRAALALLERTYDGVRRDSSLLARSVTDMPGAVGSNCACGGTILAGGECSGCLARRLTRQGMPHQEVNRVVLARTKATTRQLARRRSFMGCLNAHLASFGIGWAAITIIGSVCGVLGALAGAAAAAPTGETAAPATVPSGLALAAAFCVGVALGLPTGTVLGFIQWCWSNPDRDHPAISTASNDVTPTPDTAVT